MNNYYKVDKEDGYYRIGSLENVYSYLVVGEQRAMLYDTGFGFGDLAGTVRSITDKPLVIINSHGHGDHTLGNALFTEAAYIHESDMEICLLHTSAKDRKGAVERSKNSMDYQTGTMFNALPEGFDEEEYVTRGSGNLAMTVEGDIFDLGGVTLEIVETPGHTKGGISVWYKEKGIMFVGDAVNFLVFLFGETATGIDEYIEGLEKAYNKPISKYLGGHNHRVMTKEDVARYIKVAKEADYEKGVPFGGGPATSAQPRIYELNGLDIKDMFQPEFAAVVIGKEKKIC